MAKIPNRTLKPVSFSFGRYRGQKIEDVMKIDPCYVQWVIENVDWFGANFSCEEITSIRENCVESKFDDSIAREIDGLPGMMDINWD